MKTYDLENSNIMLSQINDWHLEKNGIARSFIFENFSAAIAFVVHVGFVAEKHNHHPDIDIRFNKVNIRLTTHDAAGITDKDFDLAKVIDAMI